MAESKRNRLASRIKTLLQGFYQGKTEGTYVYFTTPGLVTDAMVNLMDIPDSAFPLVFLRLDGPTRFDSTAEMTYSAAWTIWIEVYFKNFAKPDVFDSDMRDRLEEMFRDIDVALHVTGCLNDTPDCQLLLRRWEPEIYADTTFAGGVLEFDLEYLHKSFNA